MRKYLKGKNYNDNEKRRHYKNLLRRKKDAWNSFNQATEPPLIDLAIAEINAVNHEIDKLVKNKNENK